MRPTREQVDAARAVALVADKVFLHRAEAPDDLHLDLVCYLCGATSEDARGTRDGFEVIPEQYGRTRHMYVYCDDLAEEA